VCTITTRRNAMDAFVNGINPLQVREMRNELGLLTDLN
jgi:hypothetical protein